MEEKPSSLPLLIFFGSFTACVFAAMYSTELLMQVNGSNFEFDFKNSLVFAAFWLAYLIVCYRTLFRVMDFTPGVISLGGPREVPFHTKALFELYVFMPITLSRLVPMPLTRLLYLALGAKIGQGSYPGNGSLMDYPFCKIGSNVIFAQASIVTPHILKDGRYEIQPITIGDRVTIGPGTVVYGGTTIGDRSLVLANSSVVPGTNIGNAEIWGGNPAKFIKSIDTKKVKSFGEISAVPSPNLEPDIGFEVRADPKFEPDEKLSA